MKPSTTAVALGWFGLLLGCLATGALADEAANTSIARRLADRVNIDQYNWVFGHFKNLSAAIDVPIDVDQHSIQLEGIAPGASHSIHVGEHSAKDLLQYIIYRCFYDEKMGYLVTEDERQRTAAGFRIQIVSRRDMQKRSLLIPPADPAEAARLLAERLARPAVIDSGGDTLEGYLRRLSDAIGLPVDLHRKSLEQEGVGKLSPFKLSVGEKPAKELIEVVLSTSNAAKSLGYAAADDEQSRTEHRLRIVVASREGIEKNPARFSAPMLRPRWDEGIARALEKPVTYKATNEPLSKVLRILEKQAGVSIGIDSHEISGQAVSIDVTNQPLGVTLKKLLDGVSGSGWLEPTVVFTTWRIPAEGVKLIVTRRAEVDRHHWKLPDLYAKAAEPQGR